MECRETALPGVVVLTPVIHGDNRGFFLESYNRRTFSALGFDDEYVQDNHSRSTKNVLRGLHFQLGRGQAKLVRATLGRVWDVAADIRRGSPTFGRWAAITLDAANHTMLYIPAGFAHGFLVLSEVAEIQYKCTDFYSAELERGVAWNDPDLAIEWPLEVPPTLSQRDAGLPRLASMPDHDLPTWKG